LRNDVGARLHTGGRRISPQAPRRLTAVGRCVLSVCTAWLASSMPARAVAGITVTSPVTLTADVCDTCSPQVFLPLTITGVDPAALGVRVVDVSLGNLHDRELVGAITPRIENVGGFPALAISLTSGKLRAVGTYRVLLQFAAKGQEPVTLTLQLVRPAAMLQPPGALVVERVHGVPWSPVSNQSRPALVLLETSTRTGLSKLRVLPPIPPSTSPARIDVTTPPMACPGIASGSPDLQLPAGERRCLRYELVGAFPWGAYTQTHSISADELQAPVPIVFEVRSRLAKGYILLYALLGLLCSLILKVVLQGRLELREARLLSLDLLENVRTDLQRHPDQRFRAAVGEELVALGGAVQGTDSAAIASARTELEKAWQVGREKLATDRQAAQQKIDALRSVVETPWQIPDSMALFVEARKQQVADLRELLARDCITDADTEAQDLTRNLVGDIDGAMTWWQDNVRIFLDALVHAPTGVSPNVRSVTEQAVSEARSTIGVARLPPTAGVEALIHALQAVSEERRGARRPILAMTAAMDQEVDRAVLALRRSRGDFPELVQAITGASTALFNGVDRGDAKDEGVPASLRAVDAAWKKALEAQFGGALPPDVEQLHAQQLYVEAAAAVRAAIQARQADDSGGLATPVSSSVRPVILSDEARSPVLVFRTAALPERGLPSLRAFRASTRSYIAIAKLWQSMLVALLAGLIGFGLFAPKFIGDYQDFLVIFFWAFGLDLTVDAVTKLAPTARH